MEARTFKIVLPLIIRHDVDLEMFSLQCDLSDDYVSEIAYWPLELSGALCKFETNGFAKIDAYILLFPN